MPDMPESAVRAATRAIRALPYPHWEISEERVARAALEAATPLLAEAWGAFESELLVIDSGHPTAADRAMVARATGGGIRSGEVQVRVEDGPDLTAEPDAARLTEHVPVRFPEQLAAAAKRLAERDGVSTSTWIRHIVDRELAARSGQCHVCGQPVPEPAPSAPVPPEGKDEGS